MDPEPLRLLSFLDFPDEVRTKIYKLAIYDHDRGAVFLPRAVPRKVTPATDLDLRYAWIDEREDSNGGEAGEMDAREESMVKDLTPYYAWPINEGESRAAGVWMDKEESTMDDPDGEDVRAESRQPAAGDFASKAFSLDYTSLTRKRKDREAPGTHSRSTSSMSDCSSLEFEAAVADAMIEKAEPAHMCIPYQQDEECDCPCHNPFYVDDSEDHVMDPRGEINDLHCGCQIMDDETTEKFDNSDEESISAFGEPEACLNNECSDEECGHCGGEGLDSGYTQWELEEQEEEHDRLDEEEGIEDDEHADLDERFGMLYEPNEPAILLVRKDIRAQALAIYYSSNSFSWRFQWPKYHRSLRRFNSWVNYLRDENIKHIRQLTFEGRHAVEEGIEFGVDIDLLKDKPFFTVSTTCEYPPDETTEILRLALKRQISEPMRKWLARSPGGFVFCRTQLQDLGEVFVKSMHQPSRSVVHSPSAKTSQTGFLDLPNEIRNRIYKQAIWDHDRAVVFLPRNLPRTVLPDGERIDHDFIEYEPYDPYLDPARNYSDKFRQWTETCRSEFQGVQDDCHWQEGEWLPEEIPLPVFTEECTDDSESEESTDDSESEECSDHEESEGSTDDEEDEADVQVVEDRSVSGKLLSSMNGNVRAFLDTNAHAAAVEHFLDDFDRCDTCHQVECACYGSGDSDHEVDLTEGEEDTDNQIDGEHPPKVLSDETFDIVMSELAEDDFSRRETTIDHNDFGQRGVDSDGYLVPPMSCFNGKCAARGYPNNNECRFCAGFGLGPNQDESAYLDDPADPFTQAFENDDPLGDDEQHLNVTERMGMVFRQQEPGILLACKEIREQCLPLYFGLNLFSWRFFWLDQNRSLARFKAWTQGIDKHENHITQLSFEGRHSVEEGIDFSVDVDLLEEAPYFDIEVECPDYSDAYKDYATDAIVEALEQDFITILWKMSRRDRGRIKFSSGDLFMLGEAFSAAMQR
ncbi:hypothetical protein LTR37_010333 [Vermiconidia calcicola]|uniref:Uncharacterized protein n=1 Tax=Vermiconidia calcicola TaxID=1690605 RepID=A0ACC3N5G7_9PEZI|nr:hypothetical protein LTR37_010333 [Vermiconidia calcicola]